MGETHLILKSLEIWTISVFYNLFLLLLFFGTFLHLARDYYFSLLKKFKITVSRENWSILFFLIRDFSVFLAFGIGILLFNPDILADAKLPLPFFPLGLSFLGIALIIKVNFNKFDNFFTVLLLIAAFIELLGFVFVAEGIPEQWINLGVDNFVLTTLTSFKSNQNPQLAIRSFTFCFPILIFIMLLFVFISIKKLLKHPEQ